MIIIARRNAGLSRIASNDAIWAGERLLILARASWYALLVRASSQWEFESCPHLEHLSKPRAPLLLGSSTNREPIVPRHGFSWERGRFRGALFRGDWRVGYGII